MADTNLPHVPLGRNVPRFWTWNAPKGQAANNPYIVQMVRIKVSFVNRAEDEDPPGGALPPGYDPIDDQTYSPPQMLAIAMAHWVEYRQLLSDSICFLIQDFGADASKDCVLGLNDGDSITDGTNVSVNSIFTFDGKAECRTFFQAFADQYVSETSSRSSVQPPARFHMDSESMPRVTGNGDDNIWALFIVSDAVWAQDSKPWDVQLTDSRAGTILDPESGEQLYGGSRDSNLNTLWGLVSDDFINFTTSQSNWFDGGDLGTYGVSKWYFGLAGRVAEEAMHAACYEVAHNTWPGVLCSNYESSLASSAVHKQLSRREHTDLEFYHEGIRADLQAPVCYCPFEQWQSVWTGEELSRSDSWFYHSRKLLEAAFYTATPIHPITPWFPNIGQVTGYGAGLSAGYTTTSSDLNRLCQLAWQFGAREFLIWDDGSPTDDDWNDLSNLAYRLANEMCHRPRSPGRGRGR